MNVDQSIGGYMGMELPIIQEYHHDAIKLNSGRNALEYILHARKYKKVYLAYFNCDAVLKPFDRLGVSYDFYRIDEYLEPIFDIGNIKIDEAFLYTNYFGLKSEFIKNKLVDARNIIIDNAQSFFVYPQKGLDTFYSPRKFFGVPDGGYAYTNSDFQISLDTSISYNRISHLTKQVDLSTEMGYPDFLVNEEYINSFELAHMSQFTRRILQSVDYDCAAKKRIDNFEYLSKKLDCINTFSIVSSGEIPLSYPLLIDGNGEKLREELIKNKIFCPVFWPNVLEWCENTSWEYQLAQNLVHLPIDHRYGIEEMRIISNLIRLIMNKIE